MPTDGAPLRRQLESPHPVDVARTLRPAQRGPGDPTMRIDASGVWRAVRTPAGPATLHLAQADGRIAATAWGPGADAALAQSPGLAGCLDEPGAFAPKHPLLLRLARRLPGLCLTRTGWVLDLVVASVLEQKVPGAQARRTWRALVRRYGEPAPGPVPLFVAPDPGRLAALEYPEFHTLGVERRRADVLREVCRRAARVEEAAGMAPAMARRRLQAFRGIGPWTAAEVTRLSHGDPDAVSVGDFHAPHLVAWALAGEARGDDLRMLELLEPYAGQRGRVVLLLEAGGLRAPRYGPRRGLMDIRRL